MGPAIIEGSRPQRNHFVTQAARLSCPMPIRWVHADPVVRDWLGDVEPVWSELPKKSLLALYEPPGSERAAVHLAADLTEEETALSGVARNAVELLRYVDASRGLKFTPNGNMLRAAVADLCKTLEWPDDFVRTTFEISKAVNEADIPPLQFLRLATKEAGLLRRSGGKLIVTKDGHAILGRHRPDLLSKLFYAAFWDVNLAYFDGAAHPRWPQSHAGIVLWSLARSANNWQTDVQLARLCTVANSEIVRMPYLLRSAFLWRVLKPLIQFGLMERRERTKNSIYPADFEYRKSPLFDRLLSFRLP